MREPTIILGPGGTDEGLAAAEAARQAWGYSVGYQDQSTIIVIPTRGMFPARVVSSLLELMKPPNSPVVPLIIEGMEVGEAYNAATGMILNHPVLSKWRWILTIEEDNPVPPDALLRLQQHAVEGRWDVLGGLYHTKGFGGVPQIWGDRTRPINAQPQPRDPDGGIVPCWGTGMGCTLFSVNQFRRIPGPWFVTKNGITETGIDPGGASTQDLYHFARAHRLGVPLMVGVDCSVKVEHVDVATGQVW